MKLKTLLAALLLAATSFSLQIYPTLDAPIKSESNTVVEADTPNAPWDIPVVFSAKGDVINAPWDIPVVFSAKGDVINAPWDIPVVFSAKAKEVNAPWDIPVVF